MSNKPATTLNTFKSFVRSRDLVGIARDYRSFRDTVRLTDNEIYRFALSADAGLERPEWNDIVKLALEKHTDDASVWLDLSDLSGETAPVSLEAFLADNAECPPDASEVAALRALRVGERCHLSIGGGAVVVVRV